MDSQHINCEHDWYVDKWSNAICFDQPGFALRLVIGKCDKCGEYRNLWIDVDKADIRDEDVVVEWEAAKSEEE